MGRDDPNQLRAGSHFGQQGGLGSAPGEWINPPPEARCLVRPSTAADLPAITAMYGRFVTTTTATFEIVAPDQAEMMARRQAVLSRGLPHLVAELEGYTVGFCYASQFRPREGYRYTVEDSIYVRYAPTASATESARVCCRS